MKAKSLLLHLTTPAAVHAVALVPAPDKVLPAIPDL